MKSMKKCSFSFLILTAMLSLSVLRVNAEPTAKIYPTEGTVYTDIFLQVRGFGIGEEWDVHYKLYLFWDLEPIMTAVDDGGNHIYDIYFNPPNEHPYSDPGNHTVFVELWRSHYGWTFIANFTLTFKITEWVPCPEYITLNSTYQSLLGNYSRLLDDYDDLSGNNDSLATHYDYLNSSYYELRGDYDMLKSDFNSLESSNEDLSSSYNALVGEMGSVRNLSYIFTATTLVLIGTTVYFAVRKPRS